MSKKSSAFVLAAAFATVVPTVTHATDHTGAASAANAPRASVPSRSNNRPGTVRVRTTRWSRLLGRWTRGRLGRTTVTTRAPGELGGALRGGLVDRVAFRNSDSDSDSDSESFDREQLARAYADRQTDAQSETGLKSGAAYNRPELKRAFARAIGRTNAHQRMVSTARKVLAGSAWGWAATGASVASGDASILAGIGAATLTHGMLEGWRVMTVSRADHTAAAAHALEQRYVFANRATRSSRPFAKMAAAAGVSAAGFVAYTAAPVIGVGMVVMGLAYTMKTLGSTLRALAFVPNMTPPA